MKIVCQAAHRHLTQTIGNVGEWSKKTECWDEFRNKDTTVSSHWEQEWANTSYLAISSESEALKREWDQLRTQFVEDPRTLGELEALTGREWIARHRGDEARTHAARTWSELKGPGGRRYKNIRAFLELFSAAAKLAGDR
jgi:hypothetical protein